MGGAQMHKIISYCSFPRRVCDALLVDIYREKGISYPKFFKMDNLSRTGFLAAEEALSKAGLRNEDPKTDMSVVLVNSTSSTCDDVAFQTGLASDNYFPSPSLFVYTLSNIVCGEIAIRNKILGETSFYIDEKPSAEALASYVEWAFADKKINRVLCGWIESYKGDSPVAMMLVERDSGEGIDFTVENIEKIILNDN
jgi:3-oxoacyl-(acyl-carrier-protein) synthase